MEEYGRMAQEEIQRQENNNTHPVTYLGMNYSKELLLEFEPDDRYGTKYIPTKIVFIDLDDAFFEHLDHAHERLMRHKIQQETRRMAEYYSNASILPFNKNE